MKGKRSSRRGITDEGVANGGVGARHRRTGSGRGVLGYLNIYSQLESPIQKKRARDPRIAALKKMGIDWRWIAIAERIGFDAFIEVWTLISDLFDDERSYVRASIPHVKKLIRFQRDILIRQLHADGLTVHDIRLAVQKTYSLSISHRTIRDVICSPKFPK